MFVGRKLYRRFFSDVNEQVVIKLLLKGGYNLFEKRFLYAKDRILVPLKTIGPGNMIIMIIDQLSIYFKHIVLMPE